ncbi:glutathionylspermidine synthase family protein [Effusibacillus consociatus]|uniref:Glutathionylspermidine synthase family protein n=1 Tax=Effusibacillus consociatus TaxID=1117041 RepID=A0ABV9Q7M2_9BACL
MAASYSNRRDQIYTPIRNEGVFTWDHMYGEEYALASLHLITEEFRLDIARATEQLGRVFTRVVSVIQQAGDELLLELGIPQEALGAVRLSVTDIPTVIGRFDFARTPHGLKMLEFNSDTPTGIVEAFHVNGRVCDFFGARDPNNGMNRHLREAFEKIIRKYKELGFQTEKIVFSALDWHEEDAGTTRYLADQSGFHGPFIPLGDLRMYQDQLHALVHGQHYPIDVLYRLHALEKLAEEKDVDGYPTGAHVLDLIARQKLAIINPPSAFIAQTKALQALIWNLHEAGEFFTEQEHQIIDAHMLPTYLENRFLGNSPYVSKPIFGREGGGVTLHHPTGEPIDQDTESFYWEQPMIYQKFVELEEIEVETLRGPFPGKLLWGSFLIGGHPSAIVARAGGPITGNMSYFLPVGIQIYDLPRHDGSTLKGD